MINAVVISGLPGSGKNTLSEELSKKHGWNIHTIGDIWRERWREKFPKSEVSFEEFWKSASEEDQKQVNEEARKKIEKGNIVGDFRYAICCKDLKEVLFVFVKANIESRAKRAFHLGKYKRKTIDEIKEILKQREDQEVEWGKKLYGKDYDFRNKEDYDLIIDNTNLTLKEELDLIESKLDNQ